MFSEDRYATMPYTRCGRWGLKLPALSFGCWQTVGGYEAPGEAQKILYRAFDLGITHFDFANNYGTPDGNAEIVGGKILREMPRDELIVSSKAGYYMWPGPYGEWGSRKQIIASCDQSLRRLGLEYVDIFYHHRPDPDTPLEESLGALNTLVQQGKALYAAVSSYRGERAARAVEVCRANGWAPIVLHQPSYSLFNRWIEDDLLPVAREKGFGLIVFCPLDQGRLTDRYLEGIPPGSRAAQWPAERQKNFLPPARLEKVRKLNAIARERGQSLAQMALAWCLRLPEVTSVLTAASTVAQIEQNVAAVEKRTFESAELAAIEDILSG